jgi:hypothetical protein
VSSGRILDSTIFDYMEKIKVTNSKLIMIEKEYLKVINLDVD